ncbi:MAG: hypothetical protein QOJ04_4427 [Caballeronia sp.]|jgi:hypothetical protein|nr:hypothetical protein [Caballeronia sp.]MEA3111486.1 hypothetical protein [Caballeronia sp.]
MHALRREHVCQINCYPLTLVNSQRVPVIEMPVLLGVDCQALTVIKNLIELALNGEALVVTIPIANIINLWNAFSGPVCVKNA